MGAHFVYPIVTELHDIVKNGLSAMIAEAKHRKLIVGMVHGVRTPEEQDRIYALGRTIKNKNGFSKDKPMGDKVTNARAWESFHNYGLAVDVTFISPAGTFFWPLNRDPRWQELGAIGEIFGFKWGGRWRNPDRDHFQISDGIANGKEAKKLLLSGGLEAVYKKVSVA